MKKMFFVFGVLIILILILGFLFFYEDNLVSEPNVQESAMGCNVGNIRTGSSQEYGTFGGTIVGIESLKSRLGVMNFCCTEGTILNGGALKFCDRSEGGIIVHEIYFEKVGSVFKKKLEQLQEEINGQNTYCYYYFDNDGNIESRFCQ